MNQLSAKVRRVMFMCNTSCFIFFYHTRRKRGNRYPGNMAIRVTFLYYFLLIGIKNDTVEYN